MPDPLPWISLGVGAAGFGLATYNTIKQRQRDQPALHVRAGFELLLNRPMRMDCLALKIVNQGHRPLQINDVRFHAKRDTIPGLSGKLRMGMIPTDDSPQLPALLKDGEGLTIYYPTAQFERQNGILMEFVEVEDALGRTYLADVPGWSFDQADEATAEAS